MADGLNAWERLPSRQDAELYPFAAFLRHHWLYQSLKCGRLIYQTSMSIARQARDLLLFTSRNMGLFCLLHGKVSSLADSKSSIFSRFSFMPCCCLSLGGCVQYIRITSGSSLANCFKCGFSLKKRSIIGDTIDVQLVWERYSLD